MRAKWRVETDKDQVMILEEYTNENYMVNEEGSGRYYNRKLRTMPGMKGRAYLCDGYSGWASGKPGHVDDMMKFTIDVWIIPRSFEFMDSAVISMCSMENKEGFVLSIGKLGRIVFEAGLGKTWVTAESAEHLVKKGQWNHITATFDGEAGWMTIYLNGLAVGRKQFGRHLVMKGADCQCLIGKRNDACRLSADFEFQVFDGYISGLEIREECLDKREVHGNHQEDLKAAGGSIPHVKYEETALNPNDYSGDSNRPRYHLIAPGHWMNEPHAPVWFKGWYHIFYQANPHAPVWNNIQWGHMISKDMVHWKDMGLAIGTEEGDLDPDGCWSGSCCADENGIPVIFYTAGNDKKCPNQCVAMAKPDYPESGDFKLSKWIKNRQPVVEQTTEEGWYGEFRDPFVWREENTWCMLIGTGDADNGGGNAALYTSEDMHHWNWKNMIIDYEYDACTEVGHIWELPVLLPIADESGNIKKHILLFCACQIEHDVVENYYFTGRWNPQECRFEKDHKFPKLLDFGNGIFTGPSGLVTPDGRTVIFTLAQGKRTMKEEVEAGWAHNGGLPIELFLHNDGEVGISPIRELKLLREDKLLACGNKNIEEVNRFLHTISGNMIEAEFELNHETSLIIGNADKEIEIVYDKGRRILAAYENGKMISRYREGKDEIDLVNEKVRWHVYVDHSMVEVYVDYRKAITLRNYSSKAERYLGLKGENETNVSSAEVWRLRDILE